MEEKEKDKIIEIAIDALLKISFRTEDMFPPYRELPPSKMIEIADEAIKKIHKIRKNGDG